MSNEGETCMPIDVHFDPKTNLALCGGQSMVFHCHFYNCALQEAIERGLGADARRVQMLAAQEVARSQLGKLAPASTPPKGVLDLAAGLFKEFGFGILDFSAIGPRGGSVIVSNSHYAMGWVATRGERAEPVCDFVSGFIAGVLVAAFGTPAERVFVREIKCLGCGADHCKFDTEVL